MTTKYNGTLKMINEKWERGKSLCKQEMFELVMGAWFQSYGWYSRGTFMTVYKGFKENPCFFSYVICRYNFRRFI